MDYVDIVGLLEYPTTFGVLRKVTCLPHNHLVIALSYLEKHGLITKSGKKYNYLYLATEKGLKEYFKHRLMENLNREFEEAVQEHLEGGYNNE